jgi:hypothetical protein
MPIMMTAILERCERFGEILDVAALFALSPHDADLDDVTALV